MAGIYIHIPFCKQKCHYCNFFSVATTRHLPEISEAICREAELQSSYLQNDTVETIYFGGGTPSLLPLESLKKILNTIQKVFKADKNAEITLEANPDDINHTTAEAWKLMGINRLSIGIQSFRDTDLAYLNRIHSGQKALESIGIARNAGFSNLTIDLIYGIPGLDEQGWNQNLKTATDLQIPHISAYALTVEPRTALDTMIRKGKTPAVDEQDAANHFKQLTSELNQNGYLHYEISNFCLPGHTARHNTAYWQGKPYLGLGPSAHSFDGSSRQWNIASISEYLKSIHNNQLPFEKEELSVNQMYNEYVMTGLRTMWGCNIIKIDTMFGAAYKQHFIKTAARFISQQNMVKSGDTYILTEKGKFMADGIAADLFIV